MTWVEFLDKHADGLALLIFAFLFFLFVAGADLIAAWRGRR